MLQAFAHHVVCCCDVLEVVGWSLKLVKLQSQQVPTFLLFRGHRSVVQQCCVRLHSTSFTGEKCLIGRGLVMWRQYLKSNMAAINHLVFIRSPSTKERPLFRPVKRTNVWLHSAFLCQRDSLLSQQCYEGNFFKNFKANASLGCCDSVRVEIRLWSLPANELPSWFQFMRLPFKKWNKKRYHQISKCFLFQLVRRCFRGGPHLTENVKIFAFFLKIKLLKLLFKWSIKENLLRPRGKFRNVFQSFKNKF